MPDPRFRRGARWIFVVAATAIVFGQSSAPPTPPRFDVASVKPNRSADASMRFEAQPGRRVIIVNIPLKQLIRAAYTLQLDQIVNAPDWTDSERFDISALADRDITGATWMPGQFAPMQLMIQSLLVDRFKMRSHTEKRQSQAYALVVDGSNRGATTLAPSSEHCSQNCYRMNAGTLTWKSVPMAQFAELLSQLTGRVVTDTTGLNGTFDLQLQWSDDTHQTNTDAPSIFTAVREQLGLRLDSSRTPVDALVIDYIERPNPD
jgi:uncharacterized protein (TIGR03435 family)